MNGPAQCRLVMVAEAVMGDVSLSWRGRRHNEGRSPRSESLALIFQYGDNTVSVLLD